MYKTIGSFALAAMSAGLLLGCDQSGTSYSPASASQSVTSNYASRGADSSWPSARAGTLVAPNLLQKNYYLVLDGSGSMASNECSGSKPRLWAAQQALAQFVGALPQDSAIGLYSFDAQSNSQRVKLGVNNRDQVIHAIHASTAGGGTPLAAAIHQGYQALTEAARQQLGYGEYHLVVVTDGEASDNPAPEVAKLLDSSPINLHTIGFCIGSQHTLNQRGLTLYKSAQDTKSLSQGLQDVLAESPDFQVGSFNEG